MEVRRPVWASTPSAGQARWRKHPTHTAPRRGPEGQIGPFRHLRVIRRHLHRRETQNGGDGPHDPGQ